MLRLAWLGGPVWLLFLDDGEKPGGPRWLDGDMGSGWQSPVEVSRGWGGDGKRLVDENHCVRRLSERRERMLKIWRKRMLRNWR